ncbi:ECM33 [Candida jiufengensis]|uniref:ECM33 n=1 Tax=Candida jiufengensis TaxID=497108 RepID=UPI002225B333|nr:ECM33 [Candida jiufengensis]KAI5955677.1 ECM33 [Candida jiufengensis]
MQLKNILAVSAIASLTSAANNSTLTTATPSVNSGCSFSDFTATASGQVASVAACETAVGDVTIQGDAFGTVELTGLKQLYGDLSIINATQASTVNAPTLQLISGTFEVNANTILSNLNLAQLTTVGTLNLNALPALESTGLASGLTSADSIIISDTGLNQLTGINVYRLKVFNVNNNGDIDTIDSGLQEVTDTIDISYNAEKVDVILNQLTSANNVILQSVNSFQAPNLTQTNGSVAFSSSSIEKIELKQLKSIGKSLTINKNEDLDEVDFPKLETIGGALQISDNDNLKSLDGFPELNSVGGAVNINGSFDNGTFSSLTRVAGGFILKIDGELSCSAFNKLNSNGDVKGDKFQCQDKVTTSSSSSKKSGSDSSSDSSSSETGSSSGGSGSSSSGSSSSSSRKSDANTARVGLLASVMAAFGAIGVAFV